jgi:ribose 5-phosphate isomerase B
MKIAIGSDHAGFELKESIREMLEDEDYEVIDAGPFELNEHDDYPIYAAGVARLVSEGKADRGILVCDSGIGVDIVANKFRGIRSALVHDMELAKLTRQHNDSNVLCLGALFVDGIQAERVVRNWLDEPFSGAERHVRRLSEIADLESQLVR